MEGDDFDLNLWREEALEYEKFGFSGLLLDEIRGPEKLLAFLVNEEEEQFDVPRVFDSSFSDDVHDERRFSVGSDAEVNDELFEILTAVETDFSMNETS